MTIAIKAKNMAKYHPSADSGQAFLVMDKINFATENGEILGFLGSNGNEKSTTQRILTSLVTPNEGEIHTLRSKFSNDVYPANRTAGLRPNEELRYE